jgi:hypothetical protein
MGGRFCIDLIHAAVYSAGSIYGARFLNIIMKPMEGYFKLLETL